MLIVSFFTGSPEPMLPELSQYTLPLQNLEPLSRKESISRCGGLL